MELIINENIIIPEGTPRNKYALFGIKFPLHSGHHYILYREAILTKINSRKIDDKISEIYCLPGDVLINSTNNEAYFFKIEIEGDKNGT